MDESTTSDDGVTMFEPDADGLHHALSQLIDHRARAGSATPKRGVVDLPERLPRDGMDPDAALQVALDLGVGQSVRLDHPGYMAHMDPPTPWPTWVTAMMAASVNQNLLHPDAAPVGREVEHRVIEWLAPVFGMDGGHLVPGSTVANLTALWAARERAGVHTVVASSAAHLSIPKAAHLLGLQFREIPVADDQRLVVDDLGDLNGAALVLTAGTVAAGAIDPLTAGLGAAWRHVDAAWAGPLRFSARHRHLLDGLEAADSVSVSAHKWLYQPKESAVVMFADTPAAHSALSFGGSYLAAPNVGVLGSHGAGAAMGLLTTLLILGHHGVAARIDSDMAIAGRLCDLVERHPELELRQRHVSGVVNWRSHGVDPRHVQRELQHAWVSVAQIAGESWLRSVAANPRADVDGIVGEVMAATVRCTDHSV